jgi:hypothetical protein
VSAPDGILRPYVVAGNVCESGDVFTLRDGESEAMGRPLDVRVSADAGVAAADNGGHPLPGTRLLPELHVGDVIALHTVGAYGMAMASEYNLRSRPAEVITCVADRMTTISGAGFCDPVLARYAWQLVSGSAASWAVSRPALSPENLVEQIWNAAP